MNAKKLDKKIIKTLQKIHFPVLQYSLAIVFIWFGALKVIGYSPATDLVIHTVYWFNPTWFVPFLGAWEMLIGMCMLQRRLIRIGLALLVPQMLGTFLPLVLLPHIVYNGGPLLLTVEGQYIVKNIVLIAAAITVGSEVSK